MKKLAIMIIVLILPIIAAAEELSSMSTEDLKALRLSINNEIASRIASEKITDGTTISDLFPDEWIARHIRDELGKFSTNDIITQDELDTIEKLYISGQTSDHIQISTLEGVQHLRNLKRLEINLQENICEIPEWVGTLTKLTYLEFRYCPITIVPDCVCELINLKVLILFGSDIIELPDDIGNLTELKTLDISYTKITELPMSIYNLNLDKFNREGLDVD